MLQTRCESFGSFIFCGTCFCRSRATILGMKDLQQLEQTITSLTQINDAMRADYDAMRASHEATYNEHVALSTQYLTLAQTINGTVSDRDALKLRVIELEAIGRKNWMFLGSAESAPGRMKLFSIVSSPQRHCLSIQDYLEDAFLKLSQAAQNSPKDLELGSALLMSLLPDRWAATHPQHVHHERLRERSLVAKTSSTIDFKPD